MTIKILPARLANQIAAGEVVERPASVIKELVENSIDAGASDILIEIDRGGHKRMLIRDNGNGIPKNELSLALSRHATSKIEDIDDLESITSLGFRGEALASISSVSRLTLTSKTEDQAEAWQAHCEGREMEIQLNPAAHPKGTSLEVLDLFFNTPARKKFLRAEKTEFQHVEEIFKRIALSHCEIAFTLKHNGRVIHRFPAVPVEFKEKRIAAVCGQGFVKKSIAVHGEYQNVIVTGWCNAVGQGRGTNDLQFSFVNGRMMKDRVILHAIRQAFEGMIDSQTYPAFVLFITMPPEELDINVHPAKHEVRFHQSRQVHDLIYKSVSDSLLLNASTDAFEFTQDDEQPALASNAAPDDSSDNAQFQNQSPRAENNVTSLFEPPKHAYQQPHEAQSNTDYIAPLRPKPGHEQSGDKQLGPAGQYSATTSTYEPQARGYESKGSYGKSAGYRGPGAVNKSAASNYQSLMSAGSASDTTPLTLPFLLTDSKQLVFILDGKVRFLPSFYLAAESLYQQIQRSDVQQPLLMPVSVKKEVEHELEQRHQGMANIGLDIQLQAGKWILKQVPACMRQLPWVSILPKLLAFDDVLMGDKALLQYICFCWAQAHDFSILELQSWSEEIAQSAQLQLIEAFSDTMDVPTVTFKSTGN